MTPQFKLRLGMSPKEMAIACQTALVMGHDTVTFVVPGYPTKNGVIRIHGPRSPKGEVVCVNSDKETVASFDAIDVLAWLAAHDLVKVKVAPS